MVARILATLLFIGLLASRLDAAGRIFTDGFESGNTSLWSQADFRDLCTVVTVATDKVLGPHGGTHMARCNWNGTVDSQTAPAFESLMVTPTYTNEIFYRIWTRPDENVDRTDGSPLKINRIFFYEGDFTYYRDLFDDITSNVCLSNRGNAGNTTLATYWGCDSGDNSGTTTAWHKTEYYFNHSAEQIRVWHDGVLIRDDSVSFNSQQWVPLYIGSNWSDGHDAVNHMYFDDIEIFSDLGSGGTGSMSDATITQGGGASEPAVLQRRRTN